MGKTFSEVKNTIEEEYYLTALENFLETNGADISEEQKEAIRKDPDQYVFFGDSEDGIEVTLKEPELK